jgi:hypothetical protein
MNGPDKTSKNDAPKSDAPKRGWGSVSPDMLAPASEQTALDIWSALEAPTGAGNFPTTPRFSRSPSRFHVDLERARLFDRKDGLSSGAENPFDYELNSQKLNRTLQELFTNGYKLGALVNEAAPKPTKLTIYEQVAACFRGSSGAQPDHEWACALFASPQDRPLQTVLNTLLLCGPLCEAREIGCTSLWSNAHPDLTALLKAAVRTESDPGLILTMAWYQKESDPAGAEEIIEAALKNPASDRENLLKALAEIQERTQVVPSLPASGRSRGADLWEEPRLSTLVVQSATSLDHESFKDFVSTIIEDYPQFATPALACLANTQRSELRTWTLEAFESNSTLNPFSELLRALPVSACEPD